jgi:hypothetical protein
VHPVGEFGEDVGVAAGALRDQDVRRLGGGREVHQLEAFAGETKRVTCMARSSSAGSLAVT